MTVMDLIYKVDDKVPGEKLLFYSLQHVIVFMSAGVAVTVVVGTALGLPISEVSAMMQRAFFMAGVFSLLQVCFGHRYPIIEGSAGLWASMILLLATSMGGRLQTFRTDLWAGVLVGGAIVVIITLAGLMPYIFKLFTNAVNGVILMLMVLQISSSIMRGMAGLTAENAYLDNKSVLIFFFTVAAILILNFAARGFIKSIAALIGTAIGWLASIPLGLAKAPSGGEGFFTLPQVFAFGAPTWNPGIVVVSLFTTFVLLSMVYSGMMAMSDVVDKKIDPRGLKKGFLLHGLGALFSGIIPVVPMMPYIISAGTVVMTGVASRRPMFTAGLLLLVMGLVAPVGSLFAAIPIPVGYAVMTVMFSLIFKQGLVEVGRASAVYPDRIGYVVGISMIIGVGAMFLPFETFTQLPGVLPYLFSNGLIDGTIVVIVLDRILLKKPG